MTLFSRFKKNESGATAIEYALIAAIIGIGLIVALGPLRNSITGAFNQIGENMGTAVNNEEDPG
jgi:pilus assembly protein Flp/PilA